ncbi:MAG: hypothetical protein AB7D00_04125 [Rhodospirillaceae bacterium]
MIDKNKILNAREKRATSPSTPNVDNKDKNHSSEILLLLGKRIEKLLFVGFMLTSISIVELYFSSALKQFSDDKIQLAASILIDDLEKQIPSLSKDYTSLNDIKNKRPSYVDKNNNTPENKIRKKLGIPQKNPKNKSGNITDTQPKPTYDQRISQMLSNLRGRIGILPPEITQICNWKTPPNKILDNLKEIRTKQESKPINIWGITAPRLIELGYGSAIFQFKYEIILIVLMSVLSPLICGWLTSLYMTRQRELHEISISCDYKNSFPHVLNFIPVHFKSIVGRDPTKSDRKSLGIASALVRIIIVFVAAFPVCFFHGSVILNWHINSWFSYAHYAFFIWGTVQLAALIIQETLFWKGMYFVEK